MALQENMERWQQCRATSKTFVPFVKRKERKKMLRAALVNKNWFPVQCVVWSRCFLLLSFEHARVFQDAEHTEWLSASVELRVPLLLPKCFFSLSLSLWVHVTFNILVQTVCPDILFHARHPPCQTCRACSPQAPAVTSVKLKWRNDHMMKDGSNLGIALAVILRLMMQNDTNPQGWKFFVKIKLCKNGTK